jgi:O-antigen/teichoic acid export membrane protein
VSLDQPLDAPALSRRGILGGVAASYLQALVSLAVTFVGTPIFLRWLGQETYGLYLAATSWVGYLALFRLGFPQAAGNEMAASFARAQLDRVAATLKTSAWLAAAAALVGALLGALLLAAGVISPALFRTSEEVKHLTLPLLVIGGVGYLVALPLQQYSAGLRALRLVHVEQFATTAGRLFGLLGGVAVLAAGWGAIGFAVSQAAVTVLAGALCAWFIVRALPHDVRARARYDSALARQIFRPGMYFVLYALAGALFWGSANIVISMFESAAAVTPYAVSFRLITLAQNWLGMGITALTPTVTSLWASGQRDRLERVMLEIMKLGMAGVVPVCIGLGFFGRDFVALWAGPEAVVPAHVMWVFVATLLLVSFTAGFETFLVATSRLERYARLALLEGILNVALGVLLVRYLGSFGVAIAALVAHASVTAQFVPRTVTRMLAIRWRTVGAEVLRPLLVPTGVALGAVALSRRLAPIEGWITLIVSVALPTAGFVLAYAALGLNSWEREHLRRARTELRRRWGRP